MNEGTQVFASLCVCVHNLVDKNKHLDIVCNAQMFIFALYYLNYENIRIKKEIEIEWMLFCL